MPNSRRFAELLKGIQALRDHFLPSAFDPIGDYPDSARVQSHTRAFLILSHAEIESFLEEWAKEIARASETVWITSKTISIPLAFLLSTLATQIRIPDTVHGATNDIPQLLSGMISALYPRYYKRIKDNHGIKEKNLLDLFGPLGLASAAISNTLLPNLDSLGTKRGDLAHHSASAVQINLDPETEFNRINDLIVNDIGPFDQWLVNYKEQIK